MLHIRPTPQYPYLSQLPRLAHRVYAIDNKKPQPPNPMTSESAGHQQNANTNASGSPPPTAHPSPLTPEDRHRELDELLSDMMLTVQSIPDLKPQQRPAADDAFGLENVRYIDEEEEKNIPYHARQDSRPFSYGVNSNMIGDTKGLSSPSLVRKASFNKSNGDTLSKVQVYSGSKSPDFSNHYDPTYNASSNFNNYSNNNNYVSRKDPIDDIFTQSALNANHPIRRDFTEAYYKDETKRYDPLKRSQTEMTLRRSPEKIVTYKSSSSFDSESLSPPGAFRTKSPEFHET